MRREVLLMAVLLRKLLLYNLLWDKFVVLAEAACFDDTLAAFVHDLETMV